VVDSAMCFSDLHTTTTTTTTTTSTPDLFPPPYSGQIGSDHCPILLKLTKDMKREVEKAEIREGDDAEEK